MQLTLNSDLDNTRDIVIVRIPGGVVNPGRSDGKGLDVFRGPDDDHFPMRVVREQRRVPRDLVVCRSTDERRRRLASIDPWRLIV